MELTKFFELNPNRELLSRNFFKLLWIFVALSVCGLIGETLQHLVEYGEWEHRAGLVWGPFSPIYGSAAAFLLLLLEPFLSLPTIVLFAVSAVVGGSVEYLAHWAMETFWGVVAWSYQDWPLNFDGRTDVAHSILWGVIGVVWLRLGVPVCDCVFERINVESISYKVISSCLAVFMVFNIFFTITSLIRADERTRDVPPNDVIDTICDTYLTDDYLRSRFNNMGGLGIR